MYLILLQPSYLLQLLT